MDGRRDPRGGLGDLVADAGAAVTPAVVVGASLGLVVGLILGAIIFGGRRS